MGHLGEGALRRLRTIIDDYLASTTYGLSALKDLIESETVKYAWQDHDTATVDEDPPTKNTWYEAFDAEDVRLLFFAVRQDNDEAAVKTVAAKWTIDGNVYQLSTGLASGTLYYYYRDYEPSTGGTLGLTFTTTVVSAAYRTDKRGLAFKTEARITSDLGTNQRLRVWAVYETREST